MVFLENITLPKIRKVYIGKHKLARYPFTNNDLTNYEASRLLPDPKRMSFMKDFLAFTQL